MIVRVSPAESALLERAVLRFGGEAANAETFAIASTAMSLVAVCGDEVAGWCWGHLLPRPDGPAMLYLHHLEVDEPFRGRGVGRALVRDFIRAGAEAGANKMFLTTGADNVPARRLYESLGAGLASQGPTVNYWFHLPPPARTSAS